MCTPNLIPYDKFRPANFAKAMEYMLFISTLKPERIKFGDEKHIEGADLYSRKVRRCVLTGEIPAIKTHPHFRQRYSIVGFCGIDVRVTPFRYGISMNVNDAANFAQQVVLAIQAGWLLPGDILVLDNATIHYGGGNSDLEDWLWQYFRIFLLWLPARTPEWNPIELGWNILVARLNTFCLDVAFQISRQLVGGSHSLVVATQTILDNITHDEIRLCYRHAGYIVKE